MPCILIEIHFLLNCCVVVVVAVVFVVAFVDVSFVIVVPEC